MKITVHRSDSIPSASCPHPPWFFYCFPFLCWPLFTPLSLFLSLMFASLSSPDRKTRGSLPTPLYDWFFFRENARELAFHCIAKRERVATLIGTFNISRLSLLGDTTMYSACGVSVCARPRALARGGMRPWAVVAVLPCCMCLHVFALPFLFKPDARLLGLASISW